MAQGWLEIEHITDIMRYLPLGNSNRVVNTKY